MLPSFNGSGRDLAEVVIEVRFLVGAHTTQTPALRQVLCLCAWRSDVLQLQNREPGARPKLATESFEL